MKRAEYATRGPVPQDVISAVEFDPPPLGEGQVLLEVMASPINPSDVLTLTGQYGMLPPLPAVGGNEGVGRVAKLGPGADAWAIGELVLLPVGSGTWATHMVADAQRLIALPPQGDPRQLAMLSINPPTALLMLRDFVELKPGDWVIQNAANSAVGGYLVQIAANRGLKTVNVVRRESAIEAVKASGAEHVLVDGDDLHQRVAELTSGAAIGLGIDAVGGMASERLARCLAPAATMVNYGALSGESCMLNPGCFSFPDLRLPAFWLAHWFRSSLQEK
ncbi:MAG: zinc-dependent alcohol dehydrogenase family protein, partial [Xanthomonadales bacterium]|nr:zinc-dependent alcohol dehydrogenase family protein [Xanthomonadales bacterium]